MFKLITLSRDRSSAVLATKDGLYEVIGEDLNCVGAAARAAGAGPVWSWRAACGVGTGCPPDNVEEHHFTSKQACLDALTAEYLRRRQAQANPPNGFAFVACPCGAKNRVDIATLPATSRAGLTPTTTPTTYRCGRCHRVFTEGDIQSAIGSATGLW